MVLKQNKSIYVRKYDYLRSFYRPKSHWFFSNSDLKKYIDELTIKKISSLKDKIFFVGFNDASDEYDEQCELDSFEFDSYSSLKEMNEVDNLSTEDDDPKIIEGRIIDEQSKKFIKEKFSSCEVFDFTNSKLSIVEQFDKTIKLIKKGMNILLFQPVFISLNNKAITRPDAIVVLDGKILLIEVKGTTTSKLIHIFDLYYQLNIIEQVLNKFNKSVFDLFLCIVKYCLGNIRTINFSLTNICSINKNGFSFNDKKIKKLSFLEKIKFKSLCKEGFGKENSLTIKEMIYGLNLQNYKKAKSIYDVFFKDLNNFWSTIDQIHKYNQKKYKIDFTPEIKFKVNPIKTTDYWNNLRDYYYFDNNFCAMQYSGNLISFEDQVNLFKKTKLISDPNSFFNWFVSNKDLNFILSKPLKAMDIYIKYVAANKASNISIGKKVNDELKKLKSKKVYFDFESINLAIRPVDRWLPFTQVVNQVSLVCDHGDSILKENKPIIIDTKNGITKGDFKKIIDCILPCDDLAICNEYSYVVFNKSFECSRLKEMSQYINENEYYVKTSCIINNIFDLQDFFHISEKKSNQLVVLKELKGYYSIKKILPLVKKYDLQSYKKARCLDYKLDLVIHNGSDAQKVSTKRFFGMISDDEWERIKIDLGKYCDNDVRAMIAIEYFLKKLVGIPN